MRSKKSETRNEEISIVLTIRSVDGYYAPMVLVIMDYESV